jgi:hypothetical protein
MAADFVHRNQLVGVVVVPEKHSSLAYGATYLLE